MVVTGKGDNVFKKTPPSTASTANSVPLSHFCESRSDFGSTTCPFDDILTVFVILPPSILYALCCQCCCEIPLNFAIGSAHLCLRPRLSKMASPSINLAPSYLCCTAPRGRIENHPPLARQHRSHTEWVSITTLSSSAAVTMGWSTPRTSPRQGRRSWFSAAPLSPKKLSPAFFFPNVLTSSHFSVPRLFANSIFRATVWKSSLSMAPFLPCPAATISGASTTTPNPSAIFAATPASTPKPTTNSRR